MPNASETFRATIVAPTYNNAHTLGAVLDQLDSIGLPIVVIDDGSDDSTSDILRKWSGDALHVVISHLRNRGKADALRSGFDRARELGFTHAITFDTDGQHDVCDVAGLLHAARSNPTALILGTRTKSNRDYPFRSRVGRAISNALVRLESGARVSDSQCGLRVYPLREIGRINASSGRYAFETEIITRLAWAGVSIVQVPVRCVYDVAGGRTSHFRPIVDSVRAAHMHAGLISRRFIEWLNPIRAWREIRANQAGRKRLAASMSTGIFIATLPPYGLKTVTCLLLARWFRLQPLVVIATSSLNTPPIGTVLAAMSIVSGHLLLHGKWPALSAYDHGILSTLKSIGLEWIVGSIALGAVLALLTYFIASILIRIVPMQSNDSCDASASSATA